MRNIITIQGNKNAGKDELATMLQYILNTPKFLHHYDLFLRFKKWIKPRKNQFHIVKYAGKIKEILGVLLNVPIEKFEDREFKENTYVDFTSMSLYHIKDFTDSEKANLILNDSRFSKEIKRLDMNLTRNYVLSIRQLLQLFGTEIMRHYFGNNLWILLAMKTGHDKIIISDQRFINENIIAQTNKAIIIHIVRPGCVAGSHASEAELVQLFNEKQYDILVENTGSLRQLFNTAKNEVYNNPLFK